MFGLKKVQTVHKKNRQTQESKYYVRLKISKKLFTKNCEGSKVIFKKTHGTELNFNKSRT